MHHPRSPSSTDPRPPAYRDIVGMVRATPLERLYLEAFHKKRFRSWKELATVDRGGHAITKFPSTFSAGYLASFQVKARITWVNIDSHLIGFYEPMSNVVDHEMLDDALQRTFCPPMTPVNPGFRVVKATEFEKLLHDLKIGKPLCADAYAVGFEAKATESARAS